MNRVGASFLGALVVVLAMFWPALNFFSSTDETPEFARITDYRANFDVDADGTPRAHQTPTPPPAPPRPADPHLPAPLRRRRRRHPARPRDAHRRPPARAARDLPVLRHRR